MIRRLDNNYSSVAVIDSEEDQEDISFCSTCAANGDMSKLKERIWLDDKGKRLPDPPDADSWRMCWQCGLIIPTKDIKLSGKISGILGIEPVDNHYDIGKSTILGNDSKNRYKNLKRQKTKHPDQEVQEHIDDGYELVDYRQDIPT
jgi:hypothetical protein